MKTNDHNVSIKLTLYALTSYQIFDTKRNYVASTILDYLSMGILERMYKV